MFNAILIEKPEGQDQTVSLKQLDDQQLPEGDVTVNVLYSTLNYKDALAITGSSPVVRRFPMVPGIDFVGTVEHSNHSDYSIGDMVVLNGWGVGETHWGGFAQKARVKADWLIKLPKDITPVQSMAIGTAGYTAMLSVMALEKQGITPSSGEILVTGATGGVGSVAVSLLSSLGYDVVASTGKSAEIDYLHKLGAKNIISRDELNTKGRALNKERWAGAIDCVGSHTLANVCAATKYGGVVAACGLAQGMDFPTTVAPFILRGVMLAGVDSVMCPKPTRQDAWDRLAKELDFNMLNMISSETISLADSIEFAEKLLAGQIRGRVIVDVNS